MMKNTVCRIMAALLVCSLVFGGIVTAEENSTDWGTLLMQDSTKMSKDLALKLLDYASLYTKTMTEEQLKAEGFEVLGQYNYEKAFTDPSHTSAYTLAATKISLNGAQRTLLLITVRGTYGYEWQSNFNFAPSGDDNTQYAENFARAAMDAYFTLKPAIDSAKDPVIIVTGHSRGAAVANLLGVLLDEDRGEKDIYCYTFATPCTVRGAALEKEYSNIFNFINPADVVTRLPLTEWGYGRAGQDIRLEADVETVAAVDRGMGVLAQFAGSIHDYYDVRHALDRAGEGTEGMTGYELMSTLVASLSSMRMSGDTLTGEQMAAITPESDVYPVLILFSSLSGDKGSEVLMRHMPAAYKSLIGLLQK